MPVTGVVLYISVKKMNFLVFAFAIGLFYLVSCLVLLIREDVIRTLIHSLPFLDVVCQCLSAIFPVSCRLNPVTMWSAWIPVPGWQLCFTPKTRGLYGFQSQETLPWQLLSSSCRSTDSLLLCAVWFRSCPLCSISSKWASLVDRFWDFHGCPVRFNAWSYSLVLK